MRRQNTRFKCKKNSKTNKNNNSNDDENIVCEKMFGIFHRLDIILFVGWEHYVNKSRYDDDSEWESEKEIGERERITIVSVRNFVAIVGVYDKCFESFSGFR